jgi:hypothetical protein
MSHLDYGARCDEHVGEVFPPRCTACSLAAQEEIDELHQIHNNRTQEN